MHIAKSSSRGETATAPTCERVLLRPKRQGGDDVQCCPEASRRRESGLIVAFIMLLGSIVRCWSETDMNSCPGRMVRRRQPYSSSLFAMQAGSRDNVWYMTMLLFFLIVR